MKRKNGRLSRICSCTGMALIVFSVLLLVFRQVSAGRSAEAMQECVDTLYELIPEPQAAMTETQVNNEMPSLNIGEDDFAAIVEIPVHDAVFPVGASWNANKNYPCRYRGSVYDGSLVIGTTNRKGQFDFAKEISVGDVISITDMTGNRFSYEVSDIRYSEHADEEALSRREDDLTIFIRNIYAFEYIILHCTACGA